MQESAKYIRALYRARRVHMMPPLRHNYTRGLWRRHPLKRRWRLNGHRIHRFAKDVRAGRTITLVFLLLYGLSLALIIIYGWQGTTSIIIVDSIYIFGLFAYRYCQWLWSRLWYHRVLRPLGALGEQLGESWWPGSGRCLIGGYACAGGEPGPVECLDGLLQLTLGPLIAQAAEVPSVTAIDAALAALKQQASQSAVRARLEARPARRSWPACATWPSPSCGWPELSASPLPCATTPDDPPGHCGQ